MNNTLVGALAAIAVALFTAGGAVLVARIGARSNRENTAVAFAAQLNTRLTAVEARLGAVEEELGETREELSVARRVIDVAVRFIDRLVEWGRGGGQGSRPRPPRELHEYLDSDDWDLSVGPKPNS